MGALRYIVVYLLFYPKHIILLNLFLAYTKIRDPRLLFAYLCYILYAFTNPYILDTNQVIVILTLVMANKILEDENRVCTRNV